VSSSHPVTAICPGAYDPVTYGHLDVIRRTAEIFDRVVVGVVRDPQHKATTFTVEERVEFIRTALRDDGRAANVEVDVFAELVVDFARRWGAKTMVKGLRVISDFEWEFQMNHLNRLLAPEIETMYVMANPQYSFVSSSGVKEIASFGGDVDQLVPPAVALRFRELYPVAKPGAPVSPGE
jgi:pantetheine-phosphate adenylyltransferase